MKSLNLYILLQYKLIQEMSDNSTQSFYVNFILDWFATDAAINNVKSLHLKTVEELQDALFRNKPLARAWITKCTDFKRKDPDRYVKTDLFKTTLAGENDWWSKNDSLKNLLQKFGITTSSFSSSSPSVVPGNNSLLDNLDMFSSSSSSEEKQEKEGKTSGPMKPAAWHNEMYDDIEKVRRDYYHSYVQNMIPDRKKADKYYDFIADRVWDALYHDNPNKYTKTFYDATILGYLQLLDKLAATSADKEFLNRLSSRIEQIYV